MDNRIKVLADASLPDLKAAFGPPFKIFLYKNPTMLLKNLAGMDLLLCRSTLKVNKALLQNASLKMVATASSGVDHIDKNFLKERNIALFDAKGSNAAAVADYMLAIIAYIQKEKGFQGKKIGIIGLGAVGSLVAKRLEFLQFTLHCYDPFLPSYSQNSFEAMQHCDIIALHANLHENPPHPSKYLLNSAFFSKLKSDAVIINAARGEIVNEADLLNAQNTFLYCTDVFSNEPQINEAIINKATLVTPHIAGHTIEAKKRAVILLSQKIHQAFGLKPPIMSRNIVDKPLLLSTESWQSAVLSLYNPIKETLSLKSAPNKRQAFIDLRKAHLRHEFFCS